MDTKEAYETPLVKLVCFAHVFTSSTAGKSPTLFQSAACHYGILRPPQALRFTCCELHSQPSTYHTENHTLPWASETQSSRGKVQLIIFSWCNLPFFFLMESQDSSWGLASCSKYNQTWSPIFCLTVHSVLSRSFNEYLWVHIHVREWERGVLQKCTRNCLHTRIDRLPDLDVFFYFSHSYLPLDKAITLL